MEYTCKVCKKPFHSRKGCYSRTPQYCGKECFAVRGVSVETRAKQSLAKEGVIPWNKGVKMWEGKTHPRGTLGRVGLGKGKQVTEETRQRLREAHLAKKYPYNSKEKHWNWRGGITPENEVVRKSSDYRNWRVAVFERDNYTCQICKKIGGYLHADHILPFAAHVDKRFDIVNGRTLCMKCHRETDTYGGKMHRKMKNAKT